MKRKVVLLAFVSVLLFTAVPGTGLVEGGVNVADSGDSGQRVMSGLGAAATASEQGAWTQMASMRLPIAVREGGSLAYAGGDHIYAFGGGGSPIFERYSISANHWEGMPHLPQPVREGGSSAWAAWAGQDYIYAFSGGGTPFFWRCSIQAPGWMQMQPVGSPITPGTSLAWAGGDFMYAFTGGNAFFRYSIPGNNWQSLPSAPFSASSGADLVWTGGDHIYAFRGGGSEFWRYSISANGWTQMAGLPASVREGGSLVYIGDDHIFAFGGGGSPAFWHYSISANSWTQMANLPTSVSYGGSLAWATGDHIYAFGGGGTPMFWRFTHADVAVTSVTPSKTVVGQGYSTSINVTVQNQGSFAETFNVSVYSQPPGLVGYWKFDEGSGTTAYDSSGYSNHGTLVNGPVWTAGQVDGALSFDGVDDYVKIISDSTTLHNFSNGVTLATWIKLNYVGTNCSTDGCNIIMSDYACISGTGSALKTYEGKFEFRSYALNTILQAPFNISSDTWYHVVGTWEPSDTPKLYVNDSLVNEGGVRTFYNSSAWKNWTIGFGDCMGHPAYFNGTIDEVAIYNRALSNEEIVAHMTYHGIIGTETVTLSSGNSKTVTFTWNTAGVPKGNYTITATATPVPGETDTTDNTYTDGWVLVTIVGDVDGDHDVDVGDQRKMQLAMFTAWPNPVYVQYNTYPTFTDVDCDGDVDVSDQRKQQLHMFEMW